MKYTFQNLEVVCMSKLKERVNPSVEFKDDQMMKEIHENRLKMFEKTKYMNTEEKISLIKERAIKFKNQ